MEVVQTSDGNEIRIIKENPEQILVLGTSGHGKSIFIEKLIEAHHDAGYIVVSLVDIKDEMELCYACMTPKEKYHLRQMDRFGIKPSSKKIKIFSPFTFSIPKGNLPPINFFTIPIKTLRREELSMLCETHSDSNIIKNKISF